VLKEAHWLDMLCCCNFITPKVTYDLINLSNQALSSYSSKDFIVEACSWKGTFKLKLIDLPIDTGWDRRCSTRDTIPK
jgi:hypothetical protein